MTDTIAGASTIALLIGVLYVFGPGWAAIIGGLLGLVIAVGLTLARRNDGAA